MNNKIQSLKKDLFNSRFKKVSGQLTDTAKVSLTKRDVAKLFTELKKRKKEQQINRKINYRIKQYFLLR